MIKALLAGASALAVALGANPASAQIATRPAFAEPSLSADGRMIAFASGGDLWEVATEGGYAHLLVSNPATEARPLYSPDGRSLAFTSTRDGGDADIYVLDLASGQTRRLTYSESSDQLEAWSPDGRWLYFSSGANDIGRETDIYRVAAAGGTPMQVTREAYVGEFQAAPSPDGGRLAFTARGMSNAQWWRNGHSHMDESELWLKSLAGDGGYSQVVAPQAKVAWPMWSADGSTLTYMSDQSGAENLWQVATTGGAPRQLTNFTSGRVLFPRIAKNGGGIVFERDFAIWRYDPASGSAAPVNIELRGAPAGKASEHLRVSDFDALAVAPDGKKVAMVGHGELFAIPTKDGTSRRLTDTPGAESAPVWSPDSRRLLFLGNRGKDRILYEYDAATGATRAITTRGLAALPNYAPDGNSAVYAIDGRELRLVTFARGGRAAGDRLLYSGYVDPSWNSVRPAFSPDGRYVAIAVVDGKSFSNVWLVPTAGGPARPVSFLANGNVTGIAWSPDGKYLLFDTSQRSEASFIVRVDLTPHLPSYREDVLSELFKPDTPPGTPNKADKPKSPDRAQKDETPKPKAPAPVTIAWEGLRERATFLPLGISAFDPKISSDGKTLVFRSDSGGAVNFYSYNLDELASEPPAPKQITANTRPKGDFDFTADGKTLFYLEGGKIISTPLDTPKPAALAATGEMDVDFDREKVAAFDEAWSLLDTYFYDPAFHGKDWAGMHAQYAPLVAGAKTPDEMRRIMSLMIGELNASHSGISNPKAVQQGRVGNLGLTFDRAAYEGGRGLVVRDVLALGPVGVTGKVHQGDRLVSVNNRPIAPDMDVDQLLDHQVGKQVVLGIVDASGQRRSVTVSPVSAAVEGGLIYREWVASRRALVERLSGGRLGYVHIPNMGDEALAQLLIDLDAQNQDKQGVVVDVRNNNGGYVNGRVLDILSRREYMTMTPRGMPTFPSRQALGQRALGLPTVLLTNESTLSDGEDLTEGYRALGLGKVVGQPTASWIIYTSNVPLIDGSLVRLPSVRIGGIKGDNMELTPRPVDIAVERPMGETIAGSDAQLSAAVQTLLGQIDGRN